MCHIFVARFKGSEIEKSERVFTVKQEMSMPNDKLNRRDFVKSAVGASAAVSLLGRAPAVSGDVLGANGNINVALIGVGGRGNDLLGWVMKTGEQPNTPATTRAGVFGCSPVFITQPSKSFPRPPTPIKATLMLPFAPSTLPDTAGARPRTFIAAPAATADFTKSRRFSLSFGILISCLSLKKRSIS